MHVAAPVAAGLASGIAFIALFSFFAYSPFAATKTVSLVTILEGASMPDCNATFEPREIKVVIGYNNTVRWINKDITAHFIEADNMDDPAFWNATASSNNPAYLSPPDGTFEFAFEQPGEFGYHGKPWMQGNVVVVQPIPAG